MPQIKNIQDLIQTTGEMITTTYGAAISLDGALTYSAQCVVDVDTPGAQTFDSGAYNVSDSATVADTGVCEISDVTCVADVGVFEVSQAILVADIAGSLNSTFFLFSAKNSGGATSTNYYVWYNINSAGVDPAVVGATGIAVAGATGATASTLGGATRAAVTSIAGAKVTVTGATDTVIITGKFMGNVTNAADGSAPTGFAISTPTPGVASNLLSKYFTYVTRASGGASTNSRYVWYNVNSEGTDPAPGGTGIAVALSAGGTADTVVASSTKTALAADTNVTISGSTTHCIITNKYMGTATDAANGTASPGFSYSITQGVASNLLNKTLNFSATGNVTQYFAWFNINSEGVLPVIAGRTGIEVIGVASVTANNIASAARTAIDLVTTTTIVVSGSTNHIILTNATVGTCGATANGSASPGFTVSNSPAGAASEVSVADDTVTVPTHGFTTGDKGQLTTTGTLPAGLSTGTDYFAIVVDVNTIGFASSLALALAGTKVDITDIGSNGAVNTYTLTSIAGASVILQKSNDFLNPTNWTDEGSATTITADANVWLEKVNPSGNWMRLKFVITAGQMSSSNHIVVKGPN